jgi:maleylacetate reductase
MDEVILGTPAAAAIPAQMDRLGATRAFLMVSGTLNRETDEIAKIRSSLGPRCVGTFDAMPPHTPREAVIAATEQARAANADLIVTVAGARSPTAPRQCSFASPTMSVPSTASIRSGPAKASCRR